VSLHLASPWALLLLAAVPALLWWEARGASRRPALRLSAVAGARGRPHTWRLRLRWLPAAMRLAAIALLAVALARPQSGRADSLVPEEGIDIVLALDTSASMRTADAGEEPRLAIAAGVLEDFVAGRENDRLALVTFRARSFVNSPLTLDYAAFRTLLAQAGDLQLPEGTAIGLAVADALNLLRESKTHSRAVILLTDGENNRPEVRPAEAARISRALGVRLYTVGVTSPGGLDELPPGAAESSLRSMAELTGGRYFAAGDATTLARVYETIDGLERSRVGQQRFAAYDELAWPLLGAALALVALEVALTAFVFRRFP